MKKFHVNISLDHDNLKIETKMPNEFNSYVSNLLSYEMDNSHFIKKAMLQKGVKNFDTKVRLYKNQICSIAFCHRIIELIDMYCEKNDMIALIHYKDLRILPNCDIEVPSKLNVKLRDYQKKAVDHIYDRKISMTEICTGAGKTIIAAELIRRISKKTLFVVDRNILLKQTVDQFNKFFDSVGIITNGKINDADIVVASIQTVVKKLNQYDFSQFGCVIIDEAHGAKAKSYKKLMKHVSAQYRIGLTGTAYSDGNNSLELYRSFGFVSYRIRAIDLIKQGYLVMPEIEFIEYDNGFITHGTYNEEYEQVLRSQGRLEALRSICFQHKKQNILIMVDRIEHIELICYLLKEFDIKIIQGSTKEKERNKIIEIIKTSDSNILIATSSIIQKGVDIATLDVIVNYSANLGSIKTIQSLGRVLRKSNNKDKAYYYDFEDTFGNLRKHTKARKDALLDQGYKVL